jgi:hypothetical protein
MDSSFFSFKENFFFQAGKAHLHSLCVMPYGDQGHEERTSIPMSEKSQNHLHSFDDSMIETLLCNRKPKSPKASSATGTARTTDSRQDPTGFPARTSNPGGKTSASTHFPYSENANINSL